MQSPRQTEMLGMNKEQQREQWAAGWDKGRAAGSETEEAGSRLQLSQPLQLGQLEGLFLSPGTQTVCHTKQELRNVRPRLCYFDGF